MVVEFRTLLSYTKSIENNVFIWAGRKTQVHPGRGSSPSFFHLCIHTGPTIRKKGIVITHNTPLSFGGSPCGKQINWQNNCLRHCGIVKSRHNHRPYIICFTSTLLHGIHDILHGAFIDLFIDSLYHRNRPVFPVDTDRLSS